MLINTIPSCHHSVNIKIEIFFPSVCVLKNIFMLISISPLQIIPLIRKQNRHIRWDFKRGRETFGFVWEQLEGVNGVRICLINQRRVCWKSLFCAAEKVWGSVCVCRCASAIKVVYNNVYSHDFHYFGKPFVFPSQTTRLNTTLMQKKKASAIIKWK